MNYHERIIIRDKLHGKEDKVNISAQSTALLDMLNSSSSTGKLSTAVLMMFYPE